MGRRRFDDTTGLGHSWNRVNFLRRFAVVEVDMLRVKFSPGNDSSKLSRKILELRADPITVWFLETSGIQGRMGEQSVPLIDKPIYHGRIHFRLYMKSDYPKFYRG